MQTRLSGKKAKDLASRFIKNFAKYEGKVEAGKALVKLVRSYTEILNGNKSRDKPGEIENSSLFDEM